MFEFILNYKWQILGIHEFFGWFLTFIALYYRYYKKKPKTEKVHWILAVYSAWVPHFSYLVIDYFHYGLKPSVFDYTILGLLIFGIVFGIKYHEKMDIYFKNKFESWKQKKD